MVARLIMVIALVSILATQVMAQQTLRVEPDRLSLHENEALTLTVVGDMELSINLDSLFNLGSLELPAPDIEALEKDFEILGQNQKYSVRNINGDTHAEITWTYQLAPRRTGALTIPPLNFNDARSEPITITVQAGNAGDETGEPRDAFIELAADKDQVYVQEQLVLTVRLFFTGNLIRGDLTEPEHPDAIIESLGKQSEYSRFRDGQRYRVVERRYAIYPQTPGSLSIDPIRFEGQTRSNRGQLVFLRDSTRLFDIPVSAPPDQFGGDVWLPASALTLDERGLDNISEVSVGQSLTQTITLKAEGLPANALPPLTPTIPDGLRSYPEQPETETTVSNETLTGTLTQTTALVGVQAGTYTLPEVRVPWWDTETDQERVAVIPARTLTVLPAAGSQSTPQSPPPVNAVETEVATPSPDGPEANQRHYWPWITAVLAVGWAVTLLLWRRQGKRTVSGKRGAQNSTVEAEKDLFEALVHAADKGHAETLDLLPRWMTARYPGEVFSSTSDVLRKAGDPELKAQVNHLESRLFGARQQHESSPWDGRELVSRLAQLRRQTETKRQGDGDLPPFYPDGLNPGVR
ncbi:MAG: BatD family protein [Marinobacter sp.]|uniref:BatD family protein n=1 Tax=Marinobacter sp. TaxID=50741 RepID=UPI0034A08580